MAFDARLRESLEEGAVEFSSTANLNPARRRAECRHDARQQPIALLPVDAGHMKGHLRSLAPCGPAGEFDVGPIGRRPSVFQRDPVRIEGVRDLASHGHIADPEVRVERALLLGKRIDPRDEVGLALASERHDTRWCGGGDLSFATFLGKLPERPLEAVTSGCAAGESQSLRLEEVAELREVDVGVGGVPHRLGRTRLAEGTHG